MKTVYKLILFAIILISGYATLRLVLNGDVQPITFEIYAAIIGFTITALTTWALLGKQTENEMRKEESVRFFSLKTTIYTEFVRQMEDIIRKEKITHEDVIELRLLSQKLIFISSEEVLVAFNRFVVYFAKLADKPNIPLRDINDLMDEMTILSIKIRKDIMAHEVQRTVDEEALKNLTLRISESLDFD